MANEVVNIPMSPSLQATLIRARDYAAGQSHPEVTLEHLLLALTEDEDAANVMQSSRIDLARLRNDVAGYLGELGNRPPPGPPGAPAIAQALTDILRYATLAAKQGRRQRIDGAIVLAALVGDGRSMAASFLNAQGLTFEEAIRVLQRTALPPPAAMPAPSLSEPPQSANQSQTEGILAAARERVSTRTGQLPRAEPLPAGTATTDRVEAPYGLRRLPARDPLPPTPRYDGPSGPGQTVDPDPQASQAHPVDPAARVTPPGPAPEPAKIAEPVATAGASARLPAQVAPETAQAPHQPPRAPEPQQLAPEPLREAGEPPAAMPMPSRGTAPTSSLEDALNRHAPMPPAQAAAAAANPAGSTWVPPPLPLPGSPHQPVGPGAAAMRAPIPNPASPLPRSHPSSQVVDRGARPEPQLEHGRSDVTSRQQQEPDRVLPRPSPGNGHGWRSPGQPAPGAGPAPGSGLPSMAPTGMPPGPPATNYRPPGDAYRDGPRAPAIDASQIIHTIPARLHVGQRVQVEVRVGRHPIAGLSTGPRPAATLPEFVAARTISVRLRSAKPGLMVEAVSPETQWDQGAGASGRLSGEAAVWRFTLLPQASGQRELQLVVAARTIGADGVVADMMVPEQTITVSVARDWMAPVRAWLGRLALVMGTIVAVEFARMWLRLDLSRLVKSLFGS